MQKKSMKKVLFISCLLLPIFMFSKPKKKASNEIAKIMKQYYFVMLTQGANRVQDSATVATIQKAHLANIERLANEGKIIVAGPFGDDGNWRGIFIFDCASKEEVEKYLQTDLAVSSGRLAYEIHPWWTQTGTVFK